MIDLFKRLPQEDIELINKYINYYGGSSSERDSHMAMSGMQHFLRFWSANKIPFYKMFGEKFILSKEIYFEKDISLMEEEMDNAIRCGDSIIWGFKNYYESFIRKLNISYDDKYELCRFVNDNIMLVKNEYNGDPIIIPAKFTINKKPLQINKGVKAIKMLGKICKALGIEYNFYKCSHCGIYQESLTYNCPICGNNESKIKIDGYEVFRQAHSLVLNQKKLKGNLCLSIHPLDYITMSDNECNWHSCMQWVEEPGDYRLGTIEMMNSPYCVIAYVEAKNPMSICNDGSTWNNKRWRQLLMIVPEMILGNKQYPYFNDDLQGAAMKWLRELANNYHGEPNEKHFGPYEDEALQIRNSKYNTVGTKEFYINFWFNYMYNDIYDYRMAFIARAVEGNRIEYNLSGPAVCTECGKIIQKNCEEEVEPHWTTCRQCNNMWKCCCCGDWHYIYDDIYYAEDSDEPYCRYCYEQETEKCEVCGDRVTHTESIFIQILSNPIEEYEIYNWNFTIDVCNFCLGNEEFVKLFGEVKIGKDMYGRDRQIVLLDNISDQGLLRGELSPRVREILKQVRNASSTEARISLLQTNFY